MILTTCLNIEFNAIPTVYLSTITITTITSSFTELMKPLK
jgi:hypothetical protein